MECELTEIIRQSLEGLLEVRLINNIAPRIAEGLTKRGIEFKEIVKCKDCVGAQEYKASPVLYKCNGCNFTRGRLVSGEFWCKRGKRREREQDL